eukprot:m.207601 g.207601  ORF g.207601 m.207601 type:complete len:108 (+) comp10127_c1_seq20:479-802(+)
MRCIKVHRCMGTLSVKIPILRESRAALCSEVFHSPRLLPCLHTFCRECIATVAAIHPACPLCRVDFAAPCDSGFPLNLIANDLVEALRLQSPVSDQSVTCDGTNQRA